MPFSCINRTSHGGRSLIRYAKRSNVIELKLTNFIER